MTTKTVFQIDRAGMYMGETIADESPLEPGVWIMPAGTTSVCPPESWPDDKWPRFNGSAWDIVTKGVPVAANDPLAILEQQAAELMAQIAALKAAKQ